MRKLNMHLHYYKVLQGFNLPFSLFISLTGLFFQQHVAARMINAFSLSLMTGGFFLSIYFFEKRYYGQYFFYHNMGLSRVSLIAGSFILNAAIVILLFFIKLYLYGMS